ncbi:MAG: PEP-CTERM sorting domain-containing protein [Rhodocyclaceae bacterium]|nr:PEP-CTERM sorting domain-containing protein [Rhodocyclaceae bacterium]
MKHLTATALLAVLPLTAAAAPTINLNGLGYVTYGDANSYSLPLSGLNVMSGPGQIDMFTKLGLGANGQLGNGTAGMDNAYDTPQANNVEGFRMSAANEPDGVQGSWDRAGWWDTTLSALHSKLDLNLYSPVFFFANNETGGAGTDNLASWAQLELTRISDGMSLGLFEFTNDPDHDGVSGYGPPPIGGGVPQGDVTAFTSSGAAPVLADFVMSGGEVCLDATNAIVDCSGAGVVTSAEHNLGGDRAAYALVVPELDALLASLMMNGADLTDYALHVEYRLGCGSDALFPEVPQGQGGGTRCDPTYALNGGDEKVFIGTQLASITTTLPEPSSLLLVALGLIGSAIARTQRRA